MVASLPADPANGRQLPNEDARRLELITHKDGYVLVVNRVLFELVGSQVSGASGGFVLLLWQHLQRST